MLKQVQFSGVHPITGNVLCQPLVGNYLEKTASYTDRSLLHPRVQDFVKAVRPSGSGVYILVNALGAGEYWGCFPAGTKIKLESGEDIPIENVEEGDEVITHLNRPRKVTSLFCKSAESLIGVKPQGQSTITWSTLNHPYWAIPREEFFSLKRKIVYKRASNVSLEDARKDLHDHLHPDWISAGDLSKGDLLFLPLSKLEENHPELSLPGMAEVLGWYTAEGCVVRRRRKDRTGEPWQDCKVIITLGGHEVSVAERIVNLCNNLGWHPSVTEGYQNAYVIRIEISSPKLARICREHIGKGSRYKKLSPDLMRMPKEWQNTFLKSYSMGDGCVRQSWCKASGSLRMSTASEQLAQDIRSLAARLGMVGSIIECKQHESSLGAGNPIYEISIPSSQFGLVPSCTESFIWNDYLVCPIKKLFYEDGWKGKVYNLTVEEDNTYLANGIAVHNSNSNGDLFPEKALIHAPANWGDLTPAQMKRVGKEWAYGYPTFMNAYPYTHHQNKDPSRAFGEVVIAVWNPKMHRVELVVYLDRAKAKKFNTYDVIERVEQGEYPSVSMGCRVPFDICVVCNHKSKTRKDYCVHAMTMMNKILPDGRKVAVRNDNPKFFDISFVFIGADKTARMLAKLASSQFENFGEYCSKPRLSAEIGERFSSERLLKLSSAIEKTTKPKEDLFEDLFGDSTEPFVAIPKHKTAEEKENSWILEKVARAVFPIREKSASHKKLSEIIKEVPAGPFTKRTLPRLENIEENIPRDILDIMGGMDRSSSVSTPSMMGMVLKPREFQRIILIQMGNRPLADELEDRDEIFPPSSLIDRSMYIDQGNIDDRLKELLSIVGMIGKRSAAEPALGKRIIISINKNVPVDKNKITVTKDNNKKAILEKVSAAYNGYRSSLMKEATSIQNFMVADPLLCSDLFGQSLAQAFAGGIGKTATSVFSPDSLEYLKGAYTNREHVPT